MTRVASGEDDEHEEAEEQNESDSIESATDASSYTRSIAIPVGVASVLHGELVHI